MNNLVRRFLIELARRRAKSDFTDSVYSVLIIDS